MKKNNNKASLIIGICVFLIMIIGSTYAYFAINSTNNSSNTNVEGNLASTGNVTLITNINFISKSKLC